LILAKLNPYIILCGILLGTPARVVSEEPLTGTHEDIMGLILSLQFESADSLLTLSGTIHGSRPEILYGRNYLEFLDALVAGDRATYEHYLSGEVLRLDLMQTVNGDNPGRLAFISAIRLQTSFLNAIHGDHFRAAQNFYVSRRYFREAEQARPGDPFLRKLGGLINLVAGSAPDEYRWLMRLFGIKGDTRAGMEQLGEYHIGTSGADRLESCLILLYARQLTGPFRDAPPAGCTDDTLTLQRYFLAYHSLKSGQSREVREMLDGWKQDPGEIAFAYPDLLLGEAMLNGMDPGARDQLKRFLERSRGTFFIKTAWHKLSWYYLLEGDTLEYQRARKNVLEKGNRILDADDQAFREAEQDLIPNTILLRSRLYFDGGYYQRAYATLQEVRQGNLTGRQDSLEYVYRMARIADRLGKWEEAVSGYREVMSGGTDMAGYFPANAAFQLGMIFEEGGDTLRALDCYQRCLKMNRSAYRKSIGRKAKMGIRRLK
jgi:tetratricopeptide (TPR) repeat protein